MCDISYSAFENQANCYVLSQYSRIILLLLDNLFANAVRNQCGTVEIPATEFFIEILDANSAQCQAIIGNKVLTGI